MLKLMHFKGKKNVDFHSKEILLYSHNTNTSGTPLFWPERFINFLNSVLRHEERDNFKSLS